MNLLSIKSLQAIGLNEKNKQKCGQFNIKSSTDTKTYCIIGTINVNLQLLLKNAESEKISNFAKTTVQFLVAGPSVILDRILLGIPFLTNHSVKLHFNKNNCKFLEIVKQREGIIKKDFIQHMEIKLLYKVSM